jgi:uncharacterized integral membrane protein
LIKTGSYRSGNEAEVSVKEAIMAKKIGLGFVLLILIAIVFIQNPGEVSYRIYFWRISLSQMILLPLTLLMGFFLGLFAAGIRRSRP